MSKTIGLDWCNDSYDGTCSTGESAITHLDDVVKKYDLTYTIINMHGPGGGWPYVHITGSEENLRKLVNEQYDGPGMKMEEYLV
jgi:hypothetical protein